MKTFQWHKNDTTLKNNDLSPLNQSLFEKIKTINLKNNFSEGN